MEKSKALAMGQLFKSGDSTYVVEAVPGEGRGSYTFRCIKSGWCLDVERTDVVMWPSPAGILEVYWIASKNGRLLRPKEQTPVEKSLLMTLSEMEDAEFSTLEEALLLFSRREILDAWLRYAGISGYTDSIFSVLRALGYEVETNESDFI